MDLSFPADPLASLRSLYRRAYLAALQGELSVATELQHAWRDVLAGLGPMDAKSLAAALDEERRKVDAARVVAEVLRPYLAPEPTHAPAAPDPTESSAVNPRVPAMAQVVVDPTGAATPEVADLLDAMLRQDARRNQPRPGLAA